MKTRIMVVDDDQPLRTVLCRMLRDSDFDTEEAADGAAAAEVLREGKFDLIISDVMMPKLTGMDLLKWVKGNRPEIPVILITGFSELYEATQAIAQGASAFLPKPFRRQNLIEAIQTALTGHTANAPEENLDGNYCPISIEDFVTGSSINVSIHVRISASKYIRIAHTGEDLSAGQIDTYKKKGLTHLYVTKEDFKRYIGFGATLAKAVAKNSGIDQARKVNFLRHTAEIITQHFSSKEVDRETYQHAKNIVETSVAVLADNTDAFKLLESLNQASDYTYAHSVGVSFYAAMIGRKLKWVSPFTLTKLSMAGLLHDIGKKELPEELLKKSRAELSHADVTLLESHTLRGMEILGGIRDVPSDVIQVALQHHENGTGTGYPHRIKPSKIHPLAKVTAVADEFCYLCLPSLTSNGMPVVEALQRLVTFHDQKLDAEAIAALYEVFNLSPPAELLEQARARARVNRAS